MFRDGTDFLPRDITAPGEGEGGDSVISLNLDGHSKGANSLCNVWPPQQLSEHVYITTATVAITAIGFPAKQDGHEFGVCSC